jgi:hypothetical protein
MPALKWANSITLYTATPMLPAYEQASRAGVNMTLLGSLIEPFMRVLEDSSLQLIYVSYHL